MRKEEQYKAVKDYVDHLLTNKQRIAARFDVTIRTVNRWIAGYNSVGKSFFMHGNETLEPDCKIPEEIRGKVVSLYKGPIYNGSNFAHFHELLDKNEDIHISEQSVRNILHAANIHSPKMWNTTKKRLRLEEKQMKKEIAQAAASSQADEATMNCSSVPATNRIPPEDGHSTRPRSKFFGELIQMDASSFSWFGNITTHLHVAIDDCTGRIVGAFFDYEETLFGYYHVLKQILLTYGIPAQFLTDRRTVFEYTRHGETDVEKDTFTQFSYACKQLGISIKTTSIPQAKGRVERLNQTLQSRLPVEFRREGIVDIDAANEYLASHLDSLFNDKFSMQLNHIKSVFEMQFNGKNFNEEEVNLICSTLCTRVLIGQCIHFEKKTYKLLDQNGIQQNFIDHTKVTVIRTFDHQLFANVGENTLLKLEEVPVHVESSKNFDINYEAPKPRKIYIPALSHPWRFKEFEKHASSQRHRIKLEIEQEDQFMDHLASNVNAGYMIMGHRVA